MISRSSFPTPSGWWDPVVVPIMKFLVILLLTGFPVKHFAQADYWSNLVYFGGCPVNHIPKGIGIPDRNPKARKVIILNRRTHTAN